MEREDAGGTLLRFDLDGRDPSRWAARSAEFMSELRRLLQVVEGAGEGPAVRQFLHRLPPRGSENVARRVEPAAARLLGVAERIIERFREREEATLAEIREDPTADLEKLARRPLPIAKMLRERGAFLAGEGHDRDLVIEGVRQNEDR